VAESGSELRASDRDRDRVAAELRHHWLDGRLTLEELEQRLERAIDARTGAELDDCVHDLPRLGLLPEHRTQVGGPGVQPFTHRALFPVTPDICRAQALEKIAPALHRFDYELISQSRNGLVFERTIRPGWTIAVAILVFPFGLLALNQRNVDRIVISFEQHPGGGTEMTVHGRAPRRIRKGFATIV
jgi:hypothetical protein